MSLAGHAQSGLPQWVPPRQAQAHQRSQIKVPPAQISLHVEHGNPLAGVTASPFPTKALQAYCRYACGVAYSAASAVNPGILITSLLSATMVSATWLSGHNTATSSSPLTETPRSDRNARRIFP